MDSVKTIVGLMSAFWTSKLESIIGTGKTVGVAFPDERIESGKTRTYPAASIHIVDVSISAVRRHGGVDQVREDQPDGITSQMTFVPIPVMITWQLDTFCTGLTDDWAMMQIILAELGSRAAHIETSEGIKLYMDPQFQTTGDDLEENTRFRKIFRFSTTAWFEDPRAAETLYLVLTRTFNINSEIHSVTAEV